MKTNLAWLGSALLLCASGMTILDEYHHQNPEVKTTYIKSEPVIVEKTNYIKVKTSEQYWATLLNIESGGGKNRYRPKNKSYNCKTTKGACGHHQLTEIALADIKMCKGKLSQCKANRDNYQTSQIMANAYDKKLTVSYGCHFNGGWVRYVCWQQGPSAMKIFKASQGKTKLSNGILRNIANNSPYSYKKLKRWGSEKSAIKFLNYLALKWDKKRIKL